MRSRNKNIMEFNTREFSMIEAQVGAVYKVNGVFVMAVEGAGCVNLCCLVDDVKGCLASPGCMGKHYEKVIL